MTRIRIIAATAALGLTLVACGGVDREGTRDKLIESVEASGGTADPDCVDAALDKYDDDTLEEIDKAVAAEEPTPEATALMTELIGCISIGG